MKNLMMTGALAVSVALGGAVQGLAATGDGHGKRASFETLDADGDGQLTRAEMQAHMKARFDAADSDGDGILTRDEIEARGRQKAAERAGRMIGKLDADGDGAVSFEEMQAAKPRGARMFERADADGDGAISRAEFDDARAAMRAHRKGKAAD